MAKPKKAKAEVAKTPKNEVGNTVDYGADAGAGYENQSNSDVSIPFLSILQSNSPQITDRDDCRPGMFFDTVTEQVYEGKEKGLILIPATTQHVFVEWKPRDNGGGFVGIHSPASEMVKTAQKNAKEFNDISSPEGNDLVETFQIYGMLMDEEGELEPQMVVLAFNSTKIKVYKKYNTRLKMCTVKTPDGRKVAPPLFAHQIRVRTVAEENKHGKFFNFQLSAKEGDDVVKSLLAPGDPLLETAKELKEMVDGGVANTNYESQAKTGGNDPAPGQSPGDPAGDAKASSWNE